MSNVTNPNKPSHQVQGGQRSGHQEGGGTMNNAKEAAAGFGERASEAANYVGDQAKAAGSAMAHSAEDAASYVSKKADEGVHAVGSSLKSLGDTVRPQAPGHNMLKDGMSGVADTLENTGKYLQDEGLSGITEDVINVIKRNPVPALFVGIGVGYLLARALGPCASEHS
jgi:hypothetical protein